MVGLAGTQIEPGHLLLPERSGDAMSQEPPPEPITPRPGLLRAVGVCNLVFGGLLLVFGAGSLFLLVPFLSENQPFQVNPALANEVADDIRREMVATLRQRESTSRSEPEKRRLAVVRAELQSVRTDLSRQLDLPRVNDDLSWISRYLWINILSGPPLNLALILAGIGLARRRRWGLLLALWTAALKLVRLLTLGLLLAIVVVPSTADAADRFARTDFGRAFVNHARDQQDPFATSAIHFNPEELARILSACGYGYAAMAGALSALYPAALLLVLSRPAARAACAASTQ